MVGTELGWKVGHCNEGGETIIPSGPTAIRQKMPYILVEGAAKGEKTEGTVGCDERDTSVGWCVGLNVVWPKPDSPLFVGSNVGVTEGSKGFTGVGERAPFPVEFDTDEAVKLKKSDER